MTLLRDQAKEEIESHSRELDEAKQQHAEAQQLLQVARDEIAALQGALQAAAAGSSEEVERTLEAARQAESTAQQMRLETQVVSQQAAAEVAALVSELGSVEAALTQECQEGRASLSALSLQVQEKILQPLMVHWHRVKERTELTQSDLVEQDAAAATDPGLQAAQAAASADVQSWDKPVVSLEDASAQLPGLLARDALERQLLQQALAQAEDDAALREPQLAAESVIGPDADVLAASSWGWASYSTVEDELDAVWELIDQHKDAGFLDVYDSEAEAQEILGAPFVYTKLGLITKPRPDGSLKRRII